MSLSLLLWWRLLLTCALLGDILVTLTRFYAFFSAAK
jgi:hypothetical protein